MNPGTLYIAPLVLGLLLGFSACEKKCADAECAQDQYLQLVFIDSLDVNLIEAGLLNDSFIHVYSPSKDTLPGVADIKNGSYHVETDRDLGHYSISVGNTANVDLLVYQKLVPSDFECCPGYWRIDSVYARGRKLEKAPDEIGFYLRVE